MKIKAIQIEATGGDIEITATFSGAMVTRNHEIVVEVGRDEHADDRYAKAQEVAALIYGRDRKGRPAATNSMVHDVMNEIARVAGC